MERLSIPKGILLDLDNTLYDYDSCHSTGLTEAGKHFTSETGLVFERFIELYNECKREINRELHGMASSHNRLLYFQRIVEKLNIGVRAGLMLDLYDVYWDSFIDNIRLYDGVNQFFEKCRKESIKVALITDLTADVQIKKIHKTGIDSKINAVVTSEEAGLEKPLSSIFWLALKKIGLSPRDVWVIGDNLDKDIVGGNSIGAITILLSSRYEEKVKAKDKNAVPYLVINSFAGILNLLDGK